MAKRKQPQPFRLSAAATKKLNKYLAEIRKGIVNVCEMHTHDSNPSIKQGDFEELDIDKTLGQTAAAISVSLHSMVDGLAAQKEAEAANLNHGNIIPGKGTEDIT